MEMVEILADSLKQDLFDKMDLLHNLIHATLSEVMVLK